MHRRLNEHQVSQVKDMSRVSKPKGIAQNLSKEDPLMNYRAKDIRRAVYKLSLKRRRGLHPIQALGDRLEREDIPHEIRKDASNNVTDVFFMIPEVIKLARNHSRVLLIDATYKMNR
jgi:hypothetical protein